MSDFVLAVRVTPRSSRAALEPGRGGVLAARVTAPPVDGAANDAVIALVAKAFGVPKRDVRIVGGDTSREKRLAIAGDADTLAAIAARIANP